MRICYYTTLVSAFVVAFLTAVLSAVALEFDSAHNFTVAATQLAGLIGISAIVDGTTPDNED